MPRRGVIDLRGLLLFMCPWKEGRGAASLNRCGSFGWAMRCAAKCSNAKIVLSRGRASCEGADDEGGGRSAVSVTKPLNSLALAATIPAF